MSNRRKPKAPATLADVTANITAAESIVPLCISGAKFAEHQRLENDLQDAIADEAVSVARINDVPKSKQIAERIRALEDQMADEMVDFTFRQIDAKAWKELKADHPPKSPLRERWNGDTFPAAAVMATCIKPEVGTPEQFEAFWNRLGSGQQDILFGASVEVNEVGISVPFSASASAILARFAQTSTTPAA